jgi:hypothetical protein
MDCASRYKGGRRAALYQIRHQQWLSVSMAASSNEACTYTENHRPAALLSTEQLRHAMPVLENPAS